LAREANISEIVTRVVVLGARRLGSECRKHLGHRRLEQLGHTDSSSRQSSMTYLSNFYRRADMGKRVAFFFSATSLAGAFSGLLAAALLNMHGLGGKRGWAWIFIM
jgi:MFS family permease